MRYFDRPLFMNIKGAGRLDPRSLAVMENLAQFRQKAAKKKTVPLIRSSATPRYYRTCPKKPETTAGLYRTGVLSKKQCQMYGELIVKAIFSRP
jgi:ribonuclease D